MKPGKWGVDIATGGRGRPKAPGKRGVWPQMRIKRILLPLESRELG